MQRYDFDLVVIGAGSGGVRASRVAANLGAKVAICEKYRVGGTCVIRGCIPKKLLVYAAHYKDDFLDSSFYGWENNGINFNWSKLIKNKDQEIDRLNKIYLNILMSNNVTLYEGAARFIDKNTLEVQELYETLNRLNENKNITKDNKNIIEEYIKILIDKKIEEKNNEQ